MNFWDLVTIFTKTRITILLLLFSSNTLYYWFPYCIHVCAWMVWKIFVAEKGQSVQRPKCEYYYKDDNTPNNVNSVNT